MLIFLIIGGIAGGLLSSMVSMASLASYPVLLMTGVPPVYANVTNDAALIWNSLGAIISSTKELHGHWREVSFYAIFSTVGSAIGCTLLLIFPSSYFEKVVPFFIATSGILILLNVKGNNAKVEERPWWQKILYILALLIMGAYTGYFGAAAGVIVIVLLSYITDHHFLVVNAMKNVLSGCANLTALIIYILRSHIYWNRAIPMAIGMFIGGYLGPALLRHIPIKAVRICIAILAFIQAGYFFYTAYLQ